MLQESSPPLAVRAHPLPAPLQRRRPQSGPQPPIHLPHHNHWPPLQVAAGAGRPGPPWAAGATAAAVPEVAPRWGLTLSTVQLPWSC